MGKTFQMKCPNDGKQHVAKLDDDGKVAWCSKEVRKPGCSQPCLKRFRTVAFLVHTDVPTFETSELECLNDEQVMQKFKNVPFERHQNEAVVVDEDGDFAGMVYARQLLRMATGD